MINPLVCYEGLYDWMQTNGLEVWGRQLRTQLENAFDTNKHGHMDDWRVALARLPDLKASLVRLDGSIIQIGAASDCSPDTREKLECLLKAFHPWRKGPFDVFGILIDTEWRSDWKWDRLKDHIQDLNGRVVLDIGCGSGYHCWRMAGVGASMVLGIDPFMVYTMQYQAIRQYIPQANVYVLPLGIEHLPPQLERFDSVFSMGVLYHRKSAKEHIEELFACLRCEGELVLETLVIEGLNSDIMLPQGRYAKMRNVYAIPCCELLKNWLSECGFVQIRLVDVSDTTIEEQRSTQWMNFESLVDFLDPNDRSKTIEGYPAPKRAIFIAKKP